MLEYEVSVWDPYHRIDIDSLERVEKKGRYNWVLWETDIGLHGHRAIATFYKNRTSGYKDTGP